MKIGILTQPLLCNYGGLIQNYALQQVLIRAGYEVETINHSSKITIKSYLYTLSQRFKCLLNANRPYPLSVLSKKEKGIIQQHTNYFINKYISHTKPMTSLEDFKRQCLRGNYDAYVVGSDQCWRPKYNIYLPAMFLQFLESDSVKRIAYAASFGTDEWEYTPVETVLCRDLAQKFDFISVREDSGIRLCKDYLGVNAIHVLDPTMLLTSSDYDWLIQRENEPQSDGTLFNYILDPSSETNELITTVEKSLKLRSFKVLPNYVGHNRCKKVIKDNINECIYPSVTSWLRAFKDAQVTIVDSFHGMVFSIIYNKPFWVIGNKDRGLSRFTSLLKLFNLENRMINTTNLNEIDFAKPIDWDIVNSILNQKRKESLELLLKSLIK